MVQTNIIQAMKVLLANTYTLYLKTQNYHWNVVGPQFHSYHLLFETQYNELLEAVDEIAERIRIMGELSPGSFKEFIALKTINEANAKIDALSMIKDLAKTHNAINQLLSDLLELAKAENDEITQNLVIDRMEYHEKSIWMLNAHIT